MVVYHAGLFDDSLRVLYEYFRRRGPVDHLDLVLSTAGGSVTTTRRIALLLREYATRLTILVPYRARSAGTLLCLAADDLVLGPMAELGPMDSNIGATTATPADGPGMISAEDIRAFRRMAADWFGVDREGDRLQVLALVAQRIFPTSLSSFYRSDRLVRQIAEELLAHQLPEAPPETRRRIVDELVGGYHAHDYVLSWAEVIGLGLRARRASPQEEDLLWQIDRACRAYVSPRLGPAEDSTIGLIVGERFSARQIHSGGNHSLEPGEDPEGSPDLEWEGEARWEIEA